MRRIDPDEWRFASMIDSAYRAVVSGDYSADLSRSIMLHIACRAFRMGVAEGKRHQATGIAVTDLSTIPELRELVAERWENGRAN